MGRVRLRGRDWVKSIFLDSNVDPGSIKDVDPGTCLTWQPSNHSDRHDLVHVTGTVQHCDPDISKKKLKMCFTTPGVSNLASGGPTSCRV